MTKDIAKRNETVTANAREIGALQAFFPACFDKEGNFDLAKFQALRDNLIRLKDTEKNLRVMFDVRY